jgi:cytochrome bd ubiquinol oxidase subunit I
MDTLLLSRLQLAFTIGIASFVACLSGLWWWTEKPVYRALMRFWIRIFAPGFGMGLVTGLVMYCDKGTNWSGFSRSVSNVLGPMFMYEVMTAFFLEAGFGGVVLFGDGRVSRGMHFFACAVVAVGTLVSAIWILAANSLMQTPAGYAVDAQGIFRIVDGWHAVFNPSFPFRLMHMVCASFLTGGFVVAGVSGLHLWRGQHTETARKALSMAMWAVLIPASLQMVLGDAHGLNTRKYQPTRLAAMEGLWDSGSGVAATLLAWPDMKAERNLYALEIPHVGSLYLIHSWNGAVQGLKAVPAADRPYVPIVFFAFRIMVGVGLVLLILAITGAVLRWRGQLFTAHWFHGVCALATPLGFIGVPAGPSRRQVDSPSSSTGTCEPPMRSRLLRPSAVMPSLLLFFVIYNVLLLAFFLLRNSYRVARTERYGASGLVVLAGRLRHGGLPSELSHGLRASSARTASARASMIPSMNPRLSIPHWQSQAIGSLSL